MTAVYGRMDLDRIRLEQEAKRAAAARSIREVSSRTGRHIHDRPADQRRTKSRTVYKWRGSSEDAEEHHEHVFIWSADDEIQGAGIEV